MGGFLNGIALCLVFVTLLTVSGNELPTAHEEERGLSNPSPVVNASTELLQISNWYCSRLLDDHEWNISAVIITRYVAAKPDAHATPLNLVTKLQTCANWRRGTGPAPVPKKKYPEPDIYARVFGGIYKGMSYFFDKAAEIPKFVSRSWELLRRDWTKMNDTEITKEEVMYILTLLKDIEEKACDKEYFPLNKDEYKTYMDFIKMALEEVKDDGYLKELSHVRRGLEYCLEDQNEEYWEMEEKRKARLELESTTTTERFWAQDYIDLYGPEFDGDQYP
ncbi:unnamed protein product [Orchesella dallaii]|uniref:Uncharacterized protein n=1 Tax=Orchesella dallaii TaxID=48710 RepID=A0ABP1RKV7_9HEXA